MVLVVINVTDVMFATDSIPAIIGVTRDPFVVYTSNIFAVCGLRALYFALAGMFDRFRLLQYGLAIVLAFIGVKMLMEYPIEHYLDMNDHTITFASLGVVGSTLLGSVILSLLLAAARGRSGRRSGGWQIGNVTPSFVALLATAQNRIDSGSVFFGFCFRPAAVLRRKSCGGRRLHFIVGGETRFFATLFGDCVARRRRKSRETPGARARRPTKWRVISFHSVRHRKQRRLKSRGLRGACPAVPYSASTLRIEVRTDFLPMRCSVERHVAGCHCWLAQQCLIGFDQIAVVTKNSAGNLLIVGM